MVNVDNEQMYRNMEAVYASKQQILVLGRLCLIFKCFLSFCRNLWQVFFFVCISFMVTRIQPSDNPREAGEFYDAMEEIIQNISNMDFLVITGDFNA